MKSDPLVFGVEDATGYPSTVPNGIRVSVDVTGSGPDDDKRDRLAADLERLGVREVWRAKHTSSMHFDVPFEFIGVVRSHELVELAATDRGGTVSLNKSVPLVLKNAAGVGQIGRGYWHSSWVPRYVVVLDTGVDAGTANNGLLGRVDHTYGACYASAGGSFTRNCPNGLDEQTTGTDKAYPCVNNTGACDHGTWVSAVAAADSGYPTSNKIGVVSNSNMKVIPIRVFASHTNLNNSANAARYVDTDVEKALDFVLNLVIFSGVKVAAVNMSIGRHHFPSGSCTGTGLDNEIALLTNTYKVAVIAAAGNVNSTDTSVGTDEDEYEGLESPACVDNVIAVGSTNDNAHPIPSSEYDKVTVNIWNGGEYFSTKSHTTLDLWAPGARVTTRGPTGGIAHNFGTSFAAPHVAATWARLKGKFPNKSVSWLLSQIQSKCPTKTDPRDATISTERLCFDAAWKGQQDTSF